MIYNRFWLLTAKRLSGDATKEELQELDIFISDHPETRHFYEEAEKAWLSSPQFKATQPDDALLIEKLRKKISAANIDYPITQEEWTETTTYPRKKLVYLIVSISILVGIAAFFFFNGSVKRPLSGAAIVSASENTIFTQKGSKTRITLPDGSSVLLNADSRIYYNNDFVSKRELKLEGEAFFDVVKDESRPFIIHTSQMDVKVLGTAFNVRSYPDESISEASLIRGSIEVILKNRIEQPFILKPNEKISISSTVDVLNQKMKQEKIVTQAPIIAIKKIAPDVKDNIIREIAWTENKLFIQGERLDVVALKLERWFGKRIQVQNERLKAIRYTGNFENETLETVLQALKLSEPFRYRIENEMIIIY